MDNEVSINLGEMKLGGQGLRTIPVSMRAGYHDKRRSVPDFNLYTHGSNCLSPVNEPEL